jgi:hypothetical protein
MVPDNLTEEEKMNLRQVTNVKKPHSVAFWSLMAGIVLLVTDIGVHS